MISQEALDAWQVFEIHWNFRPDLCVELGTNPVRARVGVKKETFRVLHALIVNQIECAGLFPKSCTFMVDNQSLSLPPLNAHSVPFIELRQSLPSRVAARLSIRRSTHALHSEVSECG